MNEHLPAEDAEHAEDVELQRARQVIRAESMPLAARDALRARLIEAHPAQAEPSGRPDAPPVEQQDQQPDEQPGVVTPLRRGTVTRRWLLAAAAAATVVGAARLAIGGRNGAPGPGGGSGAPGGPDVTVLGDSVGAVSADPLQPVSFTFSTPLDHVAALRALRVQPATRVRTAWLGDMLQVTADHGFSPGSAYLVTLDRSVARTATGAAPAHDVRIGFGTAPAAVARRVPVTPQPLERQRVAAAARGSEAVITGDGSLLLTSATAGGSTGLIRFRHGSDARVADATDAICVSRTGRSIAYLQRVGSASRLVIADDGGDAQQQLDVVADDGTPLGWIGDDEVSFVSRGRLHAIARSGTLRVLVQDVLDPAQDAIAIAPGGRYVYLATGHRAGQVVDTATGRRRDLPGVNLGPEGAPAFSADGATVVWVQGSGPAARLAVAAVAAGPVLSTPLNLAVGESVSDLGVSPDWTRLVYTVSRSGGRSQLRVGSLLDGATLAYSELGGGGSPNWAPDGTSLTVLGNGESDAAQIQLIRPAAGLVSRRAAAEAVARAFANAQISGDADSAAALVSSGVPMPGAPQVTRATVLWVQQPSADQALVALRLTVDATPAKPRIEQLDERLEIDFGDGLPRITRIDIGTMEPAPTGPQLLRVDGDPTRAVTLQFDSDLDPATVSGAVSVTTPGGQAVPVAVRYDAEKRSIIAVPLARRLALHALQVRLAGTLADVDGSRLQPPAPITVTIDPA